jgi:hypothetical protein
MHLPLFLAAMPLIGLAGEAFILRWTSLLMLAAILYALPFVARNTTRPLIGSRSILVQDRISQTFISCPSRKGPYQRAMQFLREHGCRAIGILHPADELLEYPLWPIAESLHFSIQVGHVNVMNLSKRSHTHLPRAP